MQIKDSLKELFDQLIMVMFSLTTEQYSLPNKNLFNATIGQHVRHIIELFICLDKGYHTGVVNYESRERNLALETDRILAAQKLAWICGSLYNEDKQLHLESSYDSYAECTLLVPTNYFREIIYNIEHTVHHMALIRIGIEELADIDVPQEFGVAASTVKYQRKCAQ